MLFHFKTLFRIAQSSISTDRSLQLNSTEQYKEIRKNEYLYSITTNEQIPDQCNCTIECGNDCWNRSSFIECSSCCSCGDNCTNRVIQDQIEAPVERFKTTNKGWGIKATEPIESGKFIFEYLGQVINKTTYLERLANKYKNDVHNYCLEINRDHIIDSHRMGNKSRFVNHSCRPNCTMQKWLVNGTPRMALFAHQNIKKNDEITFDYNFHPFNDAPKCKCGEDNCSGSITKVHAKV